MEELQNLVVNDIINTIDKNQENENSKQYCLKSIISHWFLVTFIYLHFYKKIEKIKKIYALSSTIKSTISFLTIVEKYTIMHIDEGNFIQ